MRCFFLHTPSSLTPALTPFLPHPPLPHSLPPSPPLPHSLPPSPPLPHSLPHTTPSSLTPPPSLSVDASTLTCASQTVPPVSWTTFVYQLLKTGKGSSSESVNESARCCFRQCDSANTSGCVLGIRVPCFHWEEARVAHSEFLEWRLSSANCFVCSFE